MLISHRYKFIFTKTAKTAGTSVESYFERFCMGDAEWNQQHEREMYESEHGVIGFRGKIKGERPKWYHHMPARRIKEQVGDDIWNSYFKFSIVRNPWDKAVSAYSHFGKNYICKSHIGLFSKILHPNWSHEQRRFLSYLRHGNLPKDRNKYLINGNLCVDYVLHFEELHEGVKAVCEKVGIPWDESRLPKYKANIRKKSIKPEQLYTKPACRFIKSFYADEIQRFGYEYPFK